MRAVDVGTERRPVLDARADPVEALVAGDPLDEADQGDEGAHRHHRPDRAFDLLPGAIRVVADERERGDGLELQEIAPRLVRIGRPAGDELERREGQKERRGQPARRQLDSDLPVAHGPDDVDERHAEDEQLGDGLGPPLGGAEGEWGEDEQDERAGLDEALGPCQAHRRVTSSIHTLPPRLPSGPAVRARRTRSTTRLVSSGMRTIAVSAIQSVVPAIVLVSASVT